jgi:hypothetical protein
MKTGDKILFTFPTDVTGPTGTPSCSVVSSIQTVTCTNAGVNRVAVQLTFSPSTLPGGTGFSFLVNGITNPPSTEPTDSFTSIIGTDTAGNTLQTYTTPVAV